MGKFLHYSFLRFHLHVKSDLDYSIISASVDDISNDFLAGNDSILGCLRLAIDWKPDFHTLWSLRILQWLIVQIGRIGIIFAEWCLSLAVRFIADRLERIQ